jgi:hypothetical protein
MGLPCMEPFGSQSFGLLGSGGGVDHFTAPFTTPFMICFWHTR